MFKINYTTWLEFRKEYFGGNKQRLGQAFCNRFNITNPTLFYKTSDWDSINYIEINYVDFQTIPLNMASD